MDKVIVCDPTVAVNDVQRRPGQRSQESRSAITSRLKAGDKPVRCQHVMLPQLFTLTLYSLCIIVSLFFRVYICFEVRSIAIPSSDVRGSDSLCLRRLVRSSACSFIVSIGPSNMLVLLNLSEISLVAGKVHVRSPERPWSPVA